MELAVQPCFLCQLQSRMNQFSPRCHHWAQCRRAGSTSAGSMAGWSCNGRMQGGGGGGAAGDGDTEPQSLCGHRHWALPCCRRMGRRHSRKPGSGSNGPLSHRASILSTPPRDANIPRDAQPSPAFLLHLTNVSWQKASAARAALESLSAQLALHGGFWHFQHLLCWGKMWKEKADNERALFPRAFSKRAVRDTGAAHWGRAVLLPAQDAWDTREGNAAATAFQMEKLDRNERIHFKSPRNPPAEPRMDSQPHLSA